MRALRGLGFLAGVALLAACSGGSSNSVAPVSANGGAAAGGNGAASASTSTMTITLVRSSTTSAATKRAPQTIPVSALSVDAQVWSGSTTTGTRVATSCVNFPANANTATLSISVPQGTDTIQISSWSGGCSGGLGTGGQGTTGTGSVLSQFTGTGTVLPTSTNIATVFNNGNAIALVTPQGGTSEPINGPSMYTFFPGYSVYVAGSVANAFSYPVQSGFDGTGMTVAIVIDSAVSQSDISTYLSYAGIPTTSRTITYKSVDGGSTTVPTADQDEATLDLETIAGLAPGANIIMYIMPDLSGQSTVDAYNKILSDGLANVASSSFGGCESGGIPTGESTVFQTGAQTDRVAFVASSGDQGSTCYDGPGNYIAGVEYPASDPNVIGVGGTESWNPNGPMSIVNPAVWDDDFFGPQDDGSGGGVSTVFTIPSYQVGVAGVSSTTYRNVPDVAMPAEGVGVYLQGAWANYGGTSWSAPEFAAELAEIYQYCKTAFANPVALPYTVYARSSSDFLAITSGTNYYPPVVSSPAYAANGHYSDATGLGIPYGMPFAQTLCPNRVPSGAPAALIGVAPTPAPAQSVVVNAQPLTSSIGSDFGPKAASDQVRVQLVLRPTTTIATDEQTVIGTLESAGFTLVQTFPNNLVVDVSASTATVNTFFATTIHNVNQPTAGLRFSPSGTFTIPASLAPYVASASLDNLVRAFTGPLTH